MIELRSSSILNSGLGFSWVIWDKLMVKTQFNKNAAPANLIKRLAHGKPY
jgi:hypothetical protein